MNLTDDEMLARAIANDRARRSVVLPFTAYAREVLGQQLTAGQHALAHVAFDGADPTTELELELYGGATEIPPRARPCRKVTSSPEPSRPHASRSGS